jgi:hypothetical protein
MKDEILQILENSSMGEKETKAIYTELLALYNVSNRRELLKSFADEAQEKMYEQPDNDLSDFIEDFLKDFNCS